ncbi:MAG: Acetate kinase [Chroococcidiopsis cubana SAG 39.79]|uniref:Acetate kinase n=1 Tax=Chroococcidiopsis cubana SAG 39.79 TaxID=388085 RepID=A0AB37UF68_9CYAN|nr:acetate kinase [Chroococcidiopsis cubana]MDZ4873162.1 Acetate kinase [Chroococcidiopsis cubana SAG 39.79]PSB59446.1 acetate kinase [Chroococcidiopsis cubana CCALA 043]RUT08663.1 acetate kinase [Chroococcidiopsis cubana SAG 39.79]
MKILVLNAGSSSQKSCLYEITGDGILEQPVEPLWEATIDWTGKSAVGLLKVKTSHGASIKTEIPVKERQQAIAQMLDTLMQGETQVIFDLAEIQLVGHRVVHGGQHYSQPTRITPEVKAAIKELANLAPAHNPVNLEGIEAIEQTLPQVPQVAVFDTAFHSSIPPGAVVYPIPYELSEQGIRRYGFHGISHEYVSRRAAYLLDRDLSSLKLITCHLGNGCSLAAIRDGSCINTTMGFTPLEGLMMGTRSGSIDPSILLYLLRQGYSTEQLDEMLNKQSGLKGVSGISGDMRQISQAIAEGNDRAKLAFDIYIHRLRSHIGSMLASLSGTDALVFTAGVGENHPLTRTATCEAFEFLGLKLDPSKNQASPKDADIATSDSKIRVLVVQTQEDWAIAQSCWNLLNRES